MEEKKNKFIDPIAWAKHSFALGLVGLSIFVLLGIAELAIVFLLTCFLGGLVSLVGLLITKEGTKKPYAYAVISILTSIILFSFMMIGYDHNVQIAMEIICHNNMKHLSKTILLPSEKSTNMLEKDRWCDLIKEEVGFDSTFQCPADKIGPCSYAMNEHIPADANDLPGDLVLLFESAPGWNRVGGD